MTMATGKKKGLWIAISGLDGSGKTTLLKDLEIAFKEAGKSVYTAHLPYDQYLVKELLNKSCDSYTDRLLFALDNRLFGAELNKVRDEYDIILTQRCYLDSFVHGSVQGFSYEWIEQINRLGDLPKTDVIIHLVADAGVAYQRICDDPEGDKFEYPEYLGKQEIETRRAFSKVLIGRDPALCSFKDTENIFVDTTNKTTTETFEVVKKELTKLGVF